MTFELPNLDVMQAQQVLEQLKRRIPGYSPGWTDFNPSDPGITLLQMLVWICEGTAFTANAVPLETYRNMLRSVVGLSSAVALPGSQAQDYGTVFPYANYADNNSQDPAYEALKESLVDVEMGVKLGYSALQEAVVTYRRAPYLAITPSDLSALTAELSAFIDALAAQQGVATSLHVARLCLKQRGDVTDLFLVNDAPYTYSSPADDGTGTFAVSLTSPLDDNQAALEVALLDNVRQYLAARTLLGGAISINPAHLVYVEVQCQVRCFACERAGEVAGAVLLALEQALQPIRLDGGREWTYGACIDATTLMPLIAAAPGVDRVEALTVQTLGSQIALYRRPSPTDIGEGAMSKEHDAPPSAEVIASPVPARRPHNPPGISEAGLPRLYSAGVTALEADNG
jgi:hypothetical protein